jgi:hypothetical protein
VGLVRERVRFRRWTRDRPNRHLRKSLTRHRRGAHTIHLGEFAGGLAARLEPRLAEARAELHQAIIDAHAEGASVTVIARVSGFSRERIDQIVKRGK